MTQRDYESGVIISARIPGKLLAKIKQLAGKNRRNRSQEIVVLLEYAVELKEKDEAKATTDNR